MRKQPSKIVLNILLAVIFACVFFISGFYVGDNYNDSDESDNGSKLSDLIRSGSSDEMDLNLFWKVYDYIEHDYLKKEDIDQEAMVYGAIKGMVAALGDRHSSFMDPNTAENFEGNLAGYEGIGAYLDVKDGYVVIKSPIKGSPAEKAGIRPGDKILQIDDTPADGLSVDEVQALILGEKDTKVRLVLMRDPDDQVIEVEITRAKINIPSITWEKKEDNIAYIQFELFRVGSFKEMEKTVNEILEDGQSNRIILDLRGNSGGVLEEAVDIAGLFVGKNKTIVIEEGRNSKEKKHITEKDSQIKKWPIVVLTNKGSASASEILVGALKDHRGVKVVGQNTFGKNTVQILLDDDLEGGALKLTTAYFYTPNKTVFSENGFEPDYRVELTAEDYAAGRDPQLEKALAVIRDQ